MLHCHVESAKSLVRYITSKRNNVPVQDYITFSITFRPSRQCLTDVETVVLKYCFDILDAWEAVVNLNPRPVFCYRLHHFALRLHVWYDP